jgi:hypothetical protein
LIVSWFGNVPPCPDIGVTISVPPTNAVWDWAVRAGETSFQNNCNTPTIYSGLNSNFTVGSASISWLSDVWYTTRVSYNNSTGAMRVRQYNGIGLGGGLITDFQTVTGTTPSYWWSLNADADGGRSVFDHLTIRTWDGTLISETEKSTGLITLHGPFKNQP